MRGFGGNDLGDAGGAVTEAAGEELKVGKLVVHRLRKFHSAVVVEAESLLQMGKHARTARDGKGHAAKFAQQLVPLLEGNSAASFEEVK
jgi:hypothetical protein